ncbi:hypothetical protein COL154_009081 [Colletotrichum chrysophilum]|nr:hypothetical protein KNSL1_010196 [Colletotrichum chrysophilum]KAJ0358456.1 hypothetical protein COL154_009081 [Colletotrichum chrysophilum]
MASTVRSLGPKGLHFLLSLLFIQATVISASPTPVTGGESTNNIDSLREPLSKRVQGQFPDFPGNYNGRVQKGAYLKSLFPLSDSAAKQQNSGVTVATPWQDPRAVERWGWTREMNWSPFNTVDDEAASDDDGFDSDFDEFDATPGFGNLLDVTFADPRYPVDPAENGLSTYKHENNFYKRDGTSVGAATGASYQNVLNPRSGAIIFDRNFSPRYQIEKNKIGDVPDLEQLSDMVYFQWLDACQAKGVHPSNVRLIYRSNITYRPSFNVVLQALYNKGHQSVPGWNDRVILSMDTEEGLAILGSTHGAGAALFLIQHKAALGNKRITEVTVWGGSRGFAFNADPEYAGLSLRFTVSD